MNKIRKVGSLVLVCLIAVLSSPLAFSDDLSELQRKANGGDPEAQSALGGVYDHGLGVPENDQEAVKWYRKAADQGDAYAQVNLGFMYAKGEGVPKDYIKAYFWWNIAAVTDQKARENRDIIKGMMTPEQISEAQGLSSEYFQRQN